jgi:hypothetical protein
MTAHDAISRDSPPVPKTAANVFLAVVVVGSTDLIAYLALLGASSAVRVGVLVGLPPIALTLATVVRRIVGPGR